MHASPSLFRRHYPLRAAFTLVELLVAIAIFSILAAIALTAVKESDQDRAAAGAQQLRSMIEGARSRAIHDGLPRGLRLLLDQNNPRIVTSIVYIGAPRVYDRPFPGILGPDGRPGAINVDDDGNGRIDDVRDLGWPGSDDLVQRTTTGPYSPTWTITNPDWVNLWRRGLLKPNTEFSGARIKLPSNKSSGKWYPITRVRALDSSDADVTTTNPNNAAKIRLTIAGHLDLPNIGNDVRYALELAPSILPGSTPQPVANGVAIDLDGSNLPNSWRIDNISNPGMPTPMNANDDGYITSLDILFSPRGEVIGDAASAGVLHFLIADVEDIANAGLRFAQIVPPAPEKAERLVSLFARTGLVLTGQVNRFGLYNGGAYDLILAGKDAP